MGFREYLASESVSNTPGHALRDWRKFITKRLFEAAWAAAERGEFRFDTNALDIKENEAVDQWAFIYGLRAERIDVNGDEYRRISWDGRLV